MSPSWMQQFEAISVIIEKNTQNEQNKDDKKVLINT